MSPEERSDATSYEAFVACAWRKAAQSGYASSRVRLSLPGLHAQALEMSEIPDDAKPALELLRSVGGDEMLALMFQTFVQFADERTRAMADDVTAGRLREVAAGAHALKASARQLGALALGDACQLVEEAGKAENAAAAADGVLVVQDRYRVARDWMNVSATASSPAPVQAPQAPRAP